MDTTAVAVDSVSTLSALDYAVLDLPPVVVLLMSAGLLALAWWAGRNGFPHLRALVVLDRAPVATVASGVTGLVRVEGRAYPAEPTPEGFATPTHVWHVTSRYDTRSSPSMASSGTYSVGKILLRDATGECVLDPMQTLVVPGRSGGSVDNHMFEGATYHTEKSIATGDRVLALGTLRPKKARPDRPADLRIALRRGRGGVLLLSSKSLDATRTHLSWRALPALVVASGALAAAIWLFGTHLLRYPPPALGGFLAALFER